MSPIYNPYMASQVMPWFWLLLKEILSIFPLTRLTQADPDLVNSDQGDLHTGRGMICGGGETGGGSRWRGRMIHAGRPANSKIVFFTIKEQYLSLISFLMSHVFP